MYSTSILFKTIKTLNLDEVPLNLELGLRSLEEAFSENSAIGEIF